MTEHDETAPRSATEAPPAPGADTGESPNADLERTGSPRAAASVDGPGLDGPGVDGPGADGSQTPPPEASSPTLDHLDETIKQARHAADEALAPQRE